MRLRLCALTLALVLLCGAFAGGAESAVFAEPLQQNAVLFYPARDLSGLTRAEMSLARKSGEPLSRALIEQLLRTPVLADALPAAGERGRLSLLEDTGDVVTVGVLMSGGDERRLALCALSIWQTLMYNTPAQGVNVLINGLCPAWQGEALNTMGRPAEWKTDFEGLIGQAQSARTATVYRADLDGRYVIPVLTELPRAKSRLHALLGALCRRDESGFTRSLTEDFDIAKACQTSYGLTAEGRLQLDISFLDSLVPQTSISEALTQSGMPSWQFVAMLSLTLTTGLPGVERVRVSRGGTAIMSFPGPDGALVALKDGVVSRQSFSAQLGRALRCYAQDPENGGLVPAYSAVGVMDASAYRAVIEKCLGDALNPGDILRAEADGDLGTIDVSARLYERAQTLDQKAAHELIFRMVNALCENADVRRVQILVEGQKISCFTGLMRIDRPLYPDHGLGAVS